jgi:hypothetical protein
MKRMFTQGRSFFGTMLFAHVAIMILSLALQSSFINDWIVGHPVVYWIIYAALAVGYFWISAQESVNQSGQDAQREQNCLDRGEKEEASLTWQPWFGLRYAAVLEAPFLLLTVAAGLLRDLPRIIAGILPNLWYSAWQPALDLWPSAYPWLYLIPGVLAVIVPAVFYPEGKRRFLLMRQHMLENTERIRSNEKPIRIPRGQ